MNITGTHFNYFIVCRRKLWLFANGVQMEHTSELVAEGKVIHETSYPQRNEHYEEIEVDGCKIDFYDARRKIIHEIKKTPRMEEAHEWQVKLYIYTLEQHGVEGVHGLLEYPTLRKTKEVELNDADRQRIEEMKVEIGKVVDGDCPAKIDSKICQSCSYYEFCYVNEE